LKRQENCMSETFLEIQWLHDHASDPAVRIIDTRSKPHGAPDLVAPTGAEQYAAGHIPDAIHLDYAHELADPATPYTMRVAPAELFARTLGERGIGDANTIVAYDDGDVPYAARFVWMCRYYGRDDVRILAGGFKAWRAAAYAETTDVPTFPPAIFSTHERPTLRASRAEVIAAIEDPNVQLIETSRARRGYPAANCCWTSAAAASLPRPRSTRSSQTSHWIRASARFSPAAAASPRAVRTSPCWRPVSTTLPSTTAPGWNGATTGCPRSRNRRRNEQPEP
jgi:3-mercaptopyruvate sulfurtransferase SseA